MAHNNSRYCDCARWIMPKLPVIFDDLVKSPYIKFPRSDEVMRLVISPENRPFFSERTVRIGTTQLHIQTPTPNHTLYPLFQFTMCSIPKLDDIQRGAEYMIEHFGEPITTQVDILLLPTPYIRQSLEPRVSVVGPEHSNTGTCLKAQAPGKSAILVYRAQDMMKVLFHELGHALFPGDGKEECMGGVEIGGFEQRLPGAKGFCMWEAVQEARGLITEQYVKQGADLMRDGGDDVDELVNKLVEGCEKQARILVGVFSVEPELRTHFLEYVVGRCQQLRNRGLLRNEARVSGSLEEAREWVANFVSEVRERRILTKPPISELLVANSGMSIDNVLGDSEN